MRATPWNRGATRRLRVLFIIAALTATGCAAPDPLLSFLDEESNVSFNHPPRWNVGFAEQSGIRYRYLTAPKVEGDTEALSVTMIAPTAAASANLVAQAYLSGATDVVATPSASGESAWTFKDSSGVSSRLHLTTAGGGRFFGAWVRGSGAAMKRYQARIDAILASLRVEDAAQWPEERFAGMIARAPSTWTRGSRLSNSTNATMQFKSLPIYVERGTSTIHGFVTLSKEPVPPPGDLEAFNKMVKARASDTVALLEHHPWLELTGVDRRAGYVDYLRSGTTLTSTRIRRFITVKNGVGLTLSCEARADAFDRLDPWCQRMAYTVRLE
jgi:hypothetical protein